MKFWMLLDELFHCLLEFTNFSVAGVQRICLVVERKILSTDTSAGAGHVVLFIGLFSRSDLLLDVLLFENG